MSAEDKEETGEQEQTAENQQLGENETPELSDEGKEKVEQMRAAYDDDRKTAVLPGTDRTITGVAVNEWLDDDGNPKFGKDKQKDDDKKQDDDVQPDDAPRDDADAQQADAD
jgi:hypothetical protein